MRILIVAISAFLTATLFASDGHAADYFCKFRNETPALACIASGKSSPVFQCSIAVSAEFLDFLIHKNTSYEGVRNPEAFRIELEQFRRELEKLRKQAEGLRKEKGTDLDLYREVISSYSEGVSLYKDGISEYHKGVSF